ncbi:MAG: hypothetical protein WAQ99_22110 [Pyrinomonadaceae bacterium]
MVEPQTVPERAALYYPYIHIHNENWLKATLLCFKQVRRIVPNLYTTRDRSTVEAYTSLKGPNGPLLDTADVFAPAVHDAQRALKAKIESNLDEIKKRFQKATTPEKYQAGPASFQINRHKLLEDYREPGLAKLLEEHDLAWNSHSKKDEKSGVWLTMHPRLGSAVMSTLALAVEKNEGLHIVTPSVRAHNALLANQGDQVFNALLEIPSARRREDLGETVDELTQIVITTGFDLTRLEPQDIKNLLDDGCDLLRFRSAAASFAKLIPPGMGAKHRQQKMKEQADAVLQEWQDYRQRLPTSIRRSFRQATVEKIAEKVGEKIAEGLAVGAGTAISHRILGALPGFVVSMVLVTGVKAYRQRRNHPLRFLNRIQKTTDRSFGSLYVPQWTALAGADN